MQDNDIYVGMLVRLKSGSPLMTIVGFHRYSAENDVRCVWYQDGAFHEAKFSPAALEVGEK